AILKELRLQQRGVGGGFSKGDAVDSGLCDGQCGEVNTIPKYFIYFGIDHRHCNISRIILAVFNIGYLHVAHHNEHIPELVNRIICLGARPVGGGYGAGGRGVCESLIPENITPAPRWQTSRSGQPEGLG
ncbi:hypothetical protein J6590_073360, partial [Homalodisca vitripennis]